MNRTRAEPQVKCYSYFIFIILQDKEEEDVSYLFLSPNITGLCYFRPTRTTLTRKERAAAKLWNERWSFLGRVREIQEEEAIKLGMSLEEYRAGVRSLNCQPEPKQYPVDVDPSPSPLPRTSSAMVGRRASCPLERYGRLMKTARDHPLRPPQPPGQIYDPYKQTFIFLGIDEGDPISYKLPPATSEVTDEMWARPQQMSVAAISKDTFDMLLDTR